MGLLDPVRQQLASNSRSLCDRASAAMTTELKRNAPVVTGELKRKTGVEVRSQNRDRITAIAEIDVDYAIFVTEDTRPHVITGSPLAFRWPKRGGGVFFFNKVNHPGTTGNNFFQDTVEKWGQFLSAS